MKIGIDLGTANTIVFLPKKGVVINEPSVVAVEESTKRVIAVGQEAKEMIGKTPGDIKIYRPLKEGVIADYKVTLAILKYFISKVKSPFSFTKPEVIISVPAGISSAEKRAIVDAALEAGAKNVWPIKEPLLAAIGAGLPINASIGNMIVNIGGGTTEIAVISLGGIVTFSSLRVAGDKFDASIMDYFRRNYALIIGEQTAEKVKIKISSAIVRKNKFETDEITGVDMATGLPKTIKITSNEIAEAITRDLNQILNEIKKVLSITPPELVADIMNQGIVLSGGGALVKDLDVLISNATKIPVHVAEEPIFCVARGTGIIMEKLDVYKRVFNF